MSTRIPHLQRSSRSEQPFAKTLDRLLEDLGISARTLGQRCQKRDGWGTPSTISLLLRDQLRPTRHAMESIAGALAISPDTFAEYRLMIAREQLDPDVVGLDAALGNLAEIQASRPTGRSADASIDEEAEEADREGESSADAREARLASD